MLQLILIWAALGLLVGAVGWLAGARSVYPRGAGRWAALARLAFPSAIVALAAVMGGWLATLALGRLAASAAALGVAALAAFFVALLSQRRTVGDVTDAGSASAS